MCECVGPTEGESKGNVFECVGPTEREIGECV